MERDQRCEKIIYFETIHQSFYVIHMSPKQPKDGKISGFPFSHTHGHRIAIREQHVSLANSWLVGGTRR